MREEFNLDALPVHALAELDPKARVVNPAWREPSEGTRAAEAVETNYGERVAGSVEGPSRDNILEHADAVSGERTKHSTTSCRRGG